MNNSSNELLSTTGDILSALFTIAVIFAIFVFTYYATRYIAKNYGAVTGDKQNKIKIIERVPIGRQQSLVLIKTAGRYILLGIGSEKIQKIETFSEDEFPEDAEQTPDDEKQSFLSVLLKNIDRSKKDEQQNVFKETDDGEKT